MTKCTNENCSTFNRCFSCKKKQLEKQRERKIEKAKLTNAKHKKSKNSVNSGKDKKMLLACKGQKCYLQIPHICKGKKETVAPCHSNFLTDGKGLGLKAPDEKTVPGCVDCHFWLDQGNSPKEEKEMHWKRAYSNWSEDRLKILK